MAVGFLTKVASFGFSCPKSCFLPVVRAETARREAGKDSSCPPTPSNTPRESWAALHSPVAAHVHKGARVPMVPVSLLTLELRALQANNNMPGPQHGSPLSGAGVVKGKLQLQYS